MGDLRKILNVQSTWQKANDRFDSNKYQKSLTDIIRPDNNLKSRKYSGIATKRNRKS